MLKLLNISNFAVIERLKVEFDEGLNLLTGETGSGKSIIVDALSLLLGERSSFAQIRTGESKAFIEGVFEFTGKRAEQVRGVLADCGLEDEAEEPLIIRREINISGKNRIFINDRNVTLALLRKLQPLLVDIHGQGEQKLLLSNRAQLEMLDSYAGGQSTRKSVGEIYHRWKNSLKTLQKLRAELMEREHTEDLLRYQLAEIDSIAPQADEEERLVAERKLLTHADKILQLGHKTYLELYESDDSILARLSTITRHLQDLSLIDERLQPVLGTLSEGITLLSDVAASVRSYTESIDFSPEEFSRVESRIVELERLKRKFGANLNSILEIREHLTQKIERLGDLSETERQLKEDLAKEHAQYIREAAKLSKLREKASKKLAAEVENTLKEVAMTGARFIVELNTLSAPDASDNESEEEMIVGGNYFSQYGVDRVSFLLSANPGEAPKPLSQVASGGELSRLMLTLLTVGTKQREGFIGSETVIFDEIDAGIGGGVAEAVGRRLKFLAKTNQVICVTHQPQIARFADAHFAVAKDVLQGRTVTSIKHLEREERVRELSRMIAGDDSVSETLETARWMLKNTEI